MRARRLLVALAAGLLFLALAGDGAKAQGQAWESSQRLQKIIIQGKIAYLEAEGGYYIQGQGGAREIFIIANQNPKVLGALAKSGKIVTIEARSNGDVLTILSIDGKKYQGKQEPVFK